MACSQGNAVAILNKSAAGKRWQHLHLVRERAVSRASAEAPTRRDWYKVQCPAQWRYFSVKVDEWIYIYLPEELNDLLSLLFALIMTKKYIYDTASGES